MTTTDAWLVGDRLRIHLSGGLFGGPVAAYAAFRKAVAQGDATGTIDGSAAEGTVTGRFVSELLGRSQSLNVEVDGASWALTGAEIAALVDPDDVFRFSFIEF